MTTAYSVNTRMVLNSFMKNDADSSGNKYRHTASLASRLANNHHFMRLINVLLPNEMPNMKTGTQFGPTKINPNYISLIGAESTVRGTVWLNTQHESECVRNRLDILKLWNIDVNHITRISGSNHIVEFDLVQNSKAEDSIEILDITQMGTPAKEVDIFDNDELNKSIQVIRGTMMIAHQNIEQIDDEIKRLQAKRKEIVSQLQTIRSNIGA